jgi:putative transposase
VDPGTLRGERTQGDRAGAVFPWRVVCQEPGERSVGTATSHPRDRARQTALRLPAYPRHAATRGLECEPERVYRCYRFEGLQIDMRVRRRKYMSLHRGPVPQARRTHERWSMDFVHDQLFGGRAFRVFTIVDQFSRQTPLLQPRFSFGGRDVVAALDRAIARTGTPVSITIDHGTGFTSKVLEEWTYRRSVKLDFIHPGKPTENGHIESFNGRLRDECLNVMQFE